MFLLLEMYADPVLSLDQASYTVNENDLHLLVCVELSNPATMDITYIVQHTPGTALGIDNFVCSLSPFLVKPWVGMV